MSLFTDQLLIWYKQNKRDLPWRKTSDPYKIWISEIILQQTRIEQGTDYYLRFIKEFPDVGTLAKANPDRVMKLWQGLGYYSRARNLHHTAKEIATRYKGTFPDDYSSIIKLKGIGDYTAGAILSIAFNKPYPVVDGNVIRVISRIFGITKPASNPGIIRKIRSLAQDNMPVKKPGTYNQALMEFGALHCKPQNPICNNCPMQSICYAFRKKLVEKIPAKKPDTKIKNRTLHYLLIRYTSQKKTFVYLRKRTADDIWKNLYDLPCIETERKISLNKMKETPEWKNIFGRLVIKHNTESVEYIHKLSHQNLHAVFYDISVPKPLKKSKDILDVSIQNLHKYPVPRLIENFLVSAKLL